MKDLLYAALKCIKIPELKLKPGRYQVEGTVHLQGEVTVGYPTYYCKTPISIDTIIRLCAALNCSTERAIKLFNQAANMSTEEIEHAKRKYSAHISRAEDELREKLPRKERRGAISGKIGVRI